LRLIFNKLRSSLAQFIENKLHLSKNIAGRGEFNFSAKILAIKTSELV
jgi:hypothetical protein